THLAALVAAAKIGAHAGTEARCLADVDDLPLPVLQEIDARPRRHGGELLHERPGRGVRRGRRALLFGAHEHGIIARRRAGRPRCRGPRTSEPRIMPASLPPTKKSGRSSCHWPRTVTTLTLTPCWIQPQGGM